MVIIVASATNGPRVRAVARWVRALLPAAALVVAAPDVDPHPRCEDEDAIVGLERVPVMHHSLDGKRGPQPAELAALVTAAATMSEVSTVSAHP